MPLLVATVFAFTFLVVGAIAYLIVFRREPQGTESAAQSPRPVSTSPPVSVVEEVPADTTQITLPLEASSPTPPSLVETATGTIRPSAPVNKEADESRRLFVSLYRGLMFATGVAGLLASALMLSAVEGVSILPFIALAIAAFSVYSIYRGFVLEPELRRPRR